MKDMVVVLINKSETGKFIARFLAKTICTGAIVRTDASTEWHRF
jgi:hypothetical protein